MRVIILLLFTLSSFAQNNNQKIAYQYFINGDYDKAIVIYEELNKSNLSVNIYSPYFISLINTNNFWNPFVDLLGHMERNKFIRTNGDKNIKFSSLKNLFVVNNLEELSFHKKFNTI